MQVSWIAKVSFFGCIAVVVSGVAGPPTALALGIAFGMAFTHPFEKQSSKWAKWLLQLAVIALGFGMNAAEVVKAGRASFVFTAIGIATAMLIGLALGRLLNVRPKAAFLITAGTAICGGSAIAALAPITHPNEEEMAMSLGTIFTLNSVALLVFPLVGTALHLTQMQFGLWAALAIHDTSSVVGAAAKFGSQALAIGTAVKLTRALWIVPLALLTAFFTKSKARVKLPWFILFFCLAALAKGTFSSFSPLFGMLTQAGHIGLALTLFLIGTSISMQTIRRAGGRVMAQGVLLWVVVASASLLAICQHWISL